MCSPALVPNCLEKQSLPLPLPHAWRSRGIAQCLRILRPWIEEARVNVRNSAKSLKASHPKAPFEAENIEEILASQLAPQLLTMMLRVLALEVNIARLEGVLSGETTEERFQSFVDRLQEPKIRQQFFCEYRVLEQAIRQKLQTWATFSVEFLEHLCEDWNILKQTCFEAEPGVIAEINGGAGDTHRQGRAVMTLRFAGGAALVYKPRSLAVDERFQQLLLWLNERGVSPPLRSMKLVDGGDHGWCEFIPAKTCSEAAELEQFYERLGSFLAILHAMNASDFHYENLIAHAGHPFLIDLEALFHQRMEVSVPGSHDGAVAAIRSSVLRTGLLPMRFGIAEAYDGIDLSGVSNPSGQLTPKAIPQLDRADSDEMHIVRKRAAMTGGANCPSLNGTEASVIEYADRISNGFEATYRLILQSREEFGERLTRFAHDEVRFIARPSQTYGILLSESFHPDLLRNAAERDQFFHRLGEATAFQPALARLTEAECADLSRGDVPMFVTRPESRDLITSDGEVIPDFFEESASASVERHLAELGDADLRTQQWILRAAIATISVGSTPGSKTVQPRNDRTELCDPLASACAIADRLSDLALAKDGAANWLTLATANEGHKYVSPLGIDLYDGIPGVIYFLSYLGRVSGEGRYSELARSAVRTLRRQIEEFSDWGGIGGFSGYGGVAYALVHAGLTLDDPSLLDAAEGLLPRIESRIEADADFDVIGGSAGCAIALRSLHGVRESAATIRILRACGERLVSKTVETQQGTGWHCPGSTGTPLTGFAHGNAGIAHALHIIAAITGERQFRQTAAKAIDYERSLFSPEHRNWPDLRVTAGSKFASAWCHGAPGIGLARLCSLSFEDTATSREEIRTAMETTVSSVHHDSHILCHGALGQADMLLHGHEILGVEQWRKAAELHAAAALQQAQDPGWACGQPLSLETVGLMTGLAGIGYALLRLASPSKVPCVLALEPPRVSA